MKKKSPVSREEAILKMEVRGLILVAENDENKPCKIVDISPRDEFELFADFQRQLIKQGMSEERFNFQVSDIQNKLQLAFPEMSGSLLHKYLNIWHVIHFDFKKFQISWMTYPGANNPELRCLLCGMDKPVHASAYIDKTNPRAIIYFTCDKHYLPNIQRESEKDKIFRKMILTIVEKHAMNFYLDRTGYKRGLKKMVSTCEGDDQHKIVEMLDIVEMNEFETFVYIKALLILQGMTEDFFNLYLSQFQDELKQMFLGISDSLVQKAVNLWYILQFEFKRNKLSFMPVDSNRLRCLLCDSTAVQSSLYIDETNPRAYLYFTCNEHFLILVPMSEKATRHNIIMDVRNLVDSLYQERKLQGLPD